MVDQVLELELARLPIPLELAEWALVWTLLVCALVELKDSLTNSPSHGQVQHSVTSSYLAEGQAEEAAEACPGPSLIVGWMVSRQSAFEFLCHDQERQPRQLFESLAA